MPQIIELHRDLITISTDPARLDFDAIVDMLKRAYWATGRPREKRERAFRNSLVFGVYEVYGIVTMRDIVFKVIGKNLDPNKIKAEEIATEPIISIDKDMDIDHVISLMNKFNIARVFISEGKEIIGVASLFDIMSASLIEKARGGHVA